MIYRNNMQRSIKVTFNLKIYQQSIYATLNQSQTEKFYEEKEETPVTESEEMVWAMLEETQWEDSIENSLRLRVRRWPELGIMVAGEATW